MGWPQPSQTIFMSQHSHLITQNAQTAPRIARPRGRLPIVDEVTGTGGGAQGRESREQIVARIAAEQEGLDPNPEYTRTARRRVWILGLIMVPISLIIGWAIGTPLGWSPFLWIATGLGISLGVFYVAYVILAERDDGRIQRELDEARGQRGDGAPGA